ncbi:hypothetical protein Q6A26_22225, partial [Xanthomonas euvesicatoria pv. eucalypti]|uniref:hypothetical protein n=1 Tax=Xanthomonas euvesicatoria TaxID=456327 RepID=UPI0026E3925D
QTSPMTASLGRRPSAHILDTRNGLERIDHGISDGPHILGETRRKEDVSHISPRNWIANAGLSITSLRH